MPEHRIRSGRARIRGALCAVATAGLVAVGLAGTAGAQPLTGIDVSNWQRQIDWLLVAGSGHSFVFAKATESTTFSDVTYPLNRTGARGIGLKFGAYHFAQPSGSSDAAVVASAVAQADYFLSVAQPAPGDLLPVLDLERTGNLSPARLTLWTQAWVDQVKARTGLNAIIYVSPSFWKERLGDTSTFATNGNRLWIAHWTKETLPILPGGSWGALGWSFWQWTSCSRVPGISGCVDANRFNGTSLAPTLIPRNPTGTPVSTARPTIVGTPQRGTLLAARAGVWTGGKPVSFAYQWLRCNSVGTACAPIPGATAVGYTPVAADIGLRLAVTVTAQGADVASVAASSLPTLAVAAGGTAAGTAPVAQVLPTVQGTAIVGQTLTGLAGAWTGSPTTFGYQWRRCAAPNPCEAIAGAGGPAYTLTPGDIGSAITFVVTATGRGGTRSASSAATAVVAGAPVPVAVVGSLVAQPGQAGAVTTSTATATATWQPGAVPGGQTVTLADSASRLAVSGTAVSLATGSASPLPWPIAVQYAPRGDDVVAGFLPVSGTWRPLAELSVPALPSDQNSGAYRDPAGGIHVLTRVPGRVALFAARKWGDPRFVSATRPRLTLLTDVTASAKRDAHVVVLGRFAIDTQAHLYASVTTPGGARVVVVPTGSRLGWWVKGLPTKTIQALQLQPGALPVRLRIPARALRGTGPYTLRIIAIDPYGRRSSLTARFQAPAR
jgi:GH25 family lysozyme M1 (1,4-beta-N-acetylmuramidase)